MPSISKTKPGAEKRSAAADVISRIAPIGFDDGDGIKILLYGRSGTGKSTLWSTFPKPILSVICSGSDKPGETRSIDTPENRKTIRQVALRSSEELSAIIGHVREDDSYETVVLDHASGLQDLTLKDILGLDEIPVQKSWGMATQQEYGQCTLQCKTMMRDMLSLRQNVVIVAQEREFENEGASDFILPSVGAGLTPSLAGWLNTAVDYVCRTYIRQKEVEKEVVEMRKGKTVKVLKKVKVPGVEYCLHTAPHPVFMTKFRVPRGTPLPEQIVDPDYAKIRALISGAATA